MASTPNAVRTVVSDAPTGTWRHPHLDEISSRLNDKTFGERNIRRILLNVLIFVALILLPRLPVGHVQCVIRIIISMYNTNLRL